MVNNNVLKKEGRIYISADLVDHLRNVKHASVYFSSLLTVTSHNTALMCWYHVTAFQIIFFFFYSYLLKEWQGSEGIWHIIEP